MQSSLRISTDNSTKESSDSQEISLASLLFKYAMEEHRQSVESVMAGKEWFISFLTKKSGTALRK
jgi:hypothetical protein